MRITITFESGRVEHFNAQHFTFTKNHLVIRTSDGTPYGFNLDKIEFSQIAELDIEEDGYAY